MNILANGMAVYHHLVRAGSRVTLLDSYAEPQCLIGQLRAVEWRMTSIQTKQTPLEVLVVSQLAAIKKQERALKNRITSIPSSETAVTAYEISALQTRMDRLNRMIDAMSLTWGPTTFSSDSQAAA